MWRRGNPPTLLVGMQVGAAIVKKKTKTVCRFLRKLKIELSCVCAQSCLFVTPWTVACQALLSMEFSRQEYWSWLPLPTAGGLPNPGIEPCCCCC